MKLNIKNTIFICLLFNMFACKDSKPNDDNKLQSNASKNSIPSVEIVKRTSDSLIAISLGKHEVVIRFREVVYFDSIRLDYIASSENMLKKINTLSIDTNITNDSLFFVKHRHYFNKALDFYTNFNGFFVSEYYFINKDSLLRRYLWIDNSLSLKSYSYDYYMSPIYRNDSIINYIDSNKYVILHKNLWDESFKVK